MNYLFNYDSERIKIYQDNYILSYNKDKNNLINDIKDKILLLKPYNLLVLKHY